MECFPSGSVECSEPGLRVMIFSACESVLGEEGSQIVVIRSLAVLGSGLSHSSEYGAGGTAGFSEPWYFTLIYPLPL